MVNPQKRKIVTRMQGNKVEITGRTEGKQVIRPS
jgi:hypothetical protein